MNSIVLLGIVVTLVTGIPVLMQMLRNHPRGLIILFFAEMWERFSYYGMRGILIFYLTQHLLFDDDAASGQYGSYTSLVYLLPLIGGLLADRYLGTRKAVAPSARCCWSPATCTMAVEGTPGDADADLRRPDLRRRRRGPDGGAQRQARWSAGQAYDFGATPSGGLEIKNLPAGGAAAGGPAQGLATS